MPDTEQLNEGNAPVTVESLPNEIPVQPTRTRVAFVLITAIAAVVGLNVLVAISGIAGNTTTEFVAQKWQLLESLDQPIEWLILGDSSADQGVIPSQVEASLGGKAVNLGTIGNMLLVDDIWMLDKYIEQHGAPNNIVIVHVYDMWRREAEPAVFSLVPGFWWSMRPSLSLSASESVELLAFRYLPLYQVRNLLISLAGGRALFPTKTVISPDGFNGHEEARPHITELDLIGHKSIILPHPFELSDVNQRALNRLVELTDEHGFNVYIANSPIYEGLKSEPSFQVYFENVQEMLITLDERSRNIHYVLCDTPSFPKEIMRNIDHVNVQGAATFTKQLTESIAALPTCQRPVNN
jgi:hypothetical protein